MGGGVETALDNNWSAKFEALYVVSAVSTPRSAMFTQQCDGTLADRRRFGAPEQDFR